MKNVKDKSYQDLNRAKFSVTNSLLMLFCPEDSFTNIWMCRGLVLEILPGEKGDKNKRNEEIYL